MQQAGKLPNVVLDKIISHYAPYALGTTAAGLLGHGDVKTAASIDGVTALSALRRNPIVLDAALKSIQATQKVAPAVASATTQAVEKEDTGDWVPIQTSDGKQYLIHPEDLEEARKRDPHLRIIGDQ